MINLTLGDFEFNTDIHDGRKIEIEHLPSGRSTLINSDGGVVPSSFTDATVPADPPPGALYWNADRETLTYSDGTKFHAPAIGDNIKRDPTTVADTTTETEVYTASFASDALRENRQYSATLHGEFTTQSTDQFTLRAKIGGTTIGALTSQGTNVTAGGIRFDVTFTCVTTGTAGTIRSHSDAIFETNPVAEQFGESTLDTTTASTLQITAEWDAAAASNTLTIGQGRLLQVS